MSKEKNHQDKIALNENIEDAVLKTLKKASLEDSNPSKKSRSRSSQTVNRSLGGKAARHKPSSSNGSK